MPSRMRRQEDRRIELPSDGDWILVKKHITAGDEQDMQMRTIADWRPGEKPRLDPLSIFTAMVLTYLIDWSILDVDGRQVAIRDQPEAKLRSALKALDPYKFDEIKDAIEKHHAEMEAEREAEKNDRAGATVSPATSGSPA
jgi:hypothetical protein